MSITVAQVVGANFSRIRAEWGHRLEDVAKVAERHGLRWNTARLSRIDRGIGTVNLETALMLSVILSELTERFVSVSELLSSEESIKLGPRATLRPGGAQALTCGEGVVPHELVEEHEGMEAALSQFKAEEKEALVRLIDTMPSEGMEPRLLYLMAIVNMELADKRNAKKLGLSEPEFCAWSVRLWRHLMSEETERRAPENATAQKKGRITRELMEEMRDAVERERGND